MIYVANPLYDAVFKYLMEDERIAKTLLSALLKKKVLGVKMRRNEYANLTRSEAISMFRIDFAATVRDEEGVPRLMLIELQKTWLPTETLRFRRYLALQYNNEENMMREDKQRYALPMVAIYLLGHRVGNVKAPIFYVHHHAYDYDGNRIEDGMPDPFVESLQHGSIIVQIPLLHGMVNNRLEMLLSFFDQTNVADNHKVIRVDENQYAGDDEMEYIVRRLQSAAADPGLRQQMNVEDEFFKELEERDTALMKKDRLIKEKENTIKQKDDTIKQKDDTIKQKEDTIKQKDDAIKQKDDAIRQKEDAIKEKDDTIKEKDDLLRSMVKGMLTNGMSLEAIAQMTGKSIEEIERL